MPRIGLVTDSASGLPKDIVDQYGIAVVPIQIQFGDESFKEGVDISTQEFYRKLDGEAMPTTSQPAPGDFITAYQALAAECDHIISVHLTSKGSGTWQTARLAADMVQGPPITVIDTRSVSGCVGLAVVAGAEARAAGASVEEVVKAIKSTAARSTPYAAIPTLKYLRRSGRIPQVQAMVATLLAIRPILTVRDGLVEVAERVRTTQGAVRRVVELATKACGGRAERLAILHTNAPDQAYSLYQDVMARIECPKVMFAEMGSAMAVHGGPGMLGVALVREEDAPKTK